MPELKVKTYKSSKDLEKDAAKMLKAGWEIEHQSEKKGNVSVGTTARNVLLTGGIGWLIGGRAHLDDEITVTWTRGGEARSAAPGTSPTTNSDAVDGRRTKQCPECAERVFYEAKICRFCQFDFVASGADATLQTEFAVVLVDAGRHKVNLIKNLREVTGRGLREALAIVEGTPSVVVANVTWDEARTIQRKLEEAGGRVEVR